MSKLEIAGPRRARPAAPAAELAPPPAAAQGMPSAMLVPAPAPANRPAAPARLGRARWFMLGALLGAIGALTARGEARATLLDLRQWSARELRRLEHKPLSAMATTSLAVAAAAQPRAPVDDDCAQATALAPGGPCAELLAPFLHPREVAANDVPRVRVEDLPRVHPPAVARRHHGPA